MGQGEDKARAKADVNLNVTIQAGVNIMGSKNVVLSGKRDVGKDSTKVDDLLLGRKRRAESVSRRHRLAQRALQSVP